MSILSPPAPPASTGAPQAYSLTWVTDQLAVGCAPMSNEQLESLHAQGVDCILNLCGEFCDLHEIEAAAGFEVRYLPVPDEEAPDLAELEKALEWLDESIYLGKKVLIHCRHGIGRTGTVLNAYLLRRGLGHRMASRILRPLRSKPANFEQWWSIRKYGRKNAKLSIREPALEFARPVELGPFFSDLYALWGAADDRAAREGLPLCGRDHVRCCLASGRMAFVEAAALGHALNKSLASEERLAAVTRAAASLSDAPGNGEAAPCPLLVDGRCVLFESRPLRCRIAGLPGEEAFMEGVAAPILDRLSREVFFAFAAMLPDGVPPRFSLAETVSGKFAQIFFHYLMDMERKAPGRLTAGGEGAPGAP